MVMIKKYLQYIKESDENKDIIKPDENKYTEVKEEVKEVEDESEEVSTDPSI